MGHGELNKETILNCLTVIYKPVSVRLMVSFEMKINLLIVWCRQEISSASDLYTHQTIISTFFFFLRKVM